MTDDRHAEERIADLEARLRYTRRIVFDTLKRATYRHHDAYLTPSLREPLPIIKQPNGVEGLP